jgi:hypothetical protein
MYTYYHNAGNGSFASIAQDLWHSAHGAPRRDLGFEHVGWGPDKLQAFLTQQLALTQKLGVDGRALVRIFRVAERSRQVRCAG